MLAVPENDEVSEGLEGSVVLETSLAPGFYDLVVVLEADEVCQAVWASKCLVRQTADSYRVALIRATQLLVDVLGLVFAKDVDAHFGASPTEYFMPHWLEWTS